MDAGQAIIIYFLSRIIYIEHYLAPRTYNTLAS